MIDDIKEVLDWCRVNYRKLFPKEDWIIEDSIEYKEKHFQTIEGRKLVDTERSVDVFISIERRGDKRRGRVYYGEGSLFYDTDIDVRKAELLIKNKRKNPKNDTSKSSNNTNTAALSGFVDTTED